MANAGMNNAMVRIENRKKITKLLYQEESGITKQDIMYRLHLSAPTVNLLVQQLENDDLIFYEVRSNHLGEESHSLSDLNIVHI